MTTQLETHPEQDVAVPEITETALAQAMALLRPTVRLYHRAEASGLENVPEAGGALLVGNHSGGLLAMDVPVIAVALWDRFGAARPLRILSHDAIMWGPVGDFFRRFGMIQATRDNAREALRAGGITLVFPGGDYEAYRPTTKANTIDFNGRLGYVRTAVEAQVPIIPVVSIGGQETQIFLGRSDRLMKLMPWGKAFRTRYAPVTLGFPWVVSMGLPPQLPLPSKIVTRFLEPVDVPALAAAGSSVEDIDALVRGRMQAALDQLAAARRFPVIG